MSNQKPARATDTPPTHAGTDSRPAPDSFPSFDNDASLFEDRKPAPAPKVPEKLAPAPDPVPPKDVQGVKTIVNDPPPDAAPRVRVFEDQHSAVATIIKNNEDNTLDLSADLWGNGNPLTLYGVARRNGAGNGWEIIDPEQEQKDAQARADRSPEAVPTQERAPQMMVVLRAETVFDGVLEIDHSRYQITAGEVTVPPWHADAARAAGYHDK